MELLRGVSAANNFVLAIVPIIFAAFLVVRSQPASRRRRQQRLLRCGGTERGALKPWAAPLPPPKPAITWSSSARCHAWARIACRTRHKLSAGIACVTIRPRGLQLFDALPLRLASRRPRLRSNLTLPPPALGNAAIAASRVAS